MTWVGGDARAGRADRRRERLHPIAKLWPGTLGFYPSLLPQKWYELHTSAPPDPHYVWLETAHGLRRVKRLDVELRGEAR
jgi:hypothetical protein